MFPRDWRYLGVSLLAGLVTFFWYPDINKRRRLVLLFDGAGLGLFAVAGTQKTLIAALNPVMAIFMGVLTGIGGGILRDVLVNQTPTVLQADIYAVAALAAGVVVVIGYDLHYPAFVVLTVGALLCFWRDPVCQRPFTAQTRVQIPPGTPTLSFPGSSSASHRKGLSRRGSNFSISGNKISHS